MPAVADQRPTLALYGYGYRRRNGGGSFLHGLFVGWTLSHFFGFGGMADDPSGWDVYSKRVKWKLHVPITVSGGAVVKIGTPGGTVSGSGSQVGRSGGVSSCSGAVTLPESNGKPYVPIELRELGSTRHKVKVRLIGNPVAWAFVPACGTSIGNATSALTDQTGPTFFDDQANPTFSILTADNFRAGPSSFGAKWDRPPLMYQRKIDDVVSSTVKVEPR